MLNGELYKEEIDEIDVECEIAIKDGKPVRCDKNIYCTECGRNIVLNGKEVCSSKKLVEWAISEHKEEPKPCPFCGGNAKLYKIDATNSYVVECEKCYCKTSACIREERAIKVWNRRTE